MCSHIPAAQRIDQPSPIALLKACKNPAELAGMRACHLRDGAAVVEFLAWLEHQFNSSGGDGGDGNNSGGSAGGSTQQMGISEVALADKLQSFRAQCGSFLEPSFATIAGVNENGAIIHYRQVQ
jgi:Xaa-Pro aminopeptidase